MPAHTEINISLNLTVTRPRFEHEDERIARHHINEALEEVNRALEEFGGIGIVTAVDCNTVDYDPETSEPTHVNDMADHSDVGEAFNSLRDHLGLTG